MCLIIFAYDCHPRYKLVMAANRDEFYRRADQPAAFWSDHPTILAGRDLEHGGTWMGITTAGRFAALTNYRDPASISPNAPSRGHLVQNFLAGTADPMAYIKDLPDQGAAYNGFNLLAGDQDSLYYFSNREKLIRRIEPGVHGISNSLLDVPWPKLTRCVDTLFGHLCQDEIDVEALFTMMADRFQPPDEDLPKTGVSLAFEQMLAPAFVLSSEYGTKSTSVLLIGHDKQVSFTERSFKPATMEPWNEVHFEFKMD